MTPGHVYNTAGAEDTWFPLGTDTDGFNLKDGWSNQDGKDTPGGTEETFALLTPELLPGDGGAESLIGAQFRYSTNGITTEEGGAWVTVTFTGDPVRIPIEYLDTLQFKGPADVAGAFNIKIEAVTVDTDPDTGEKVEAMTGSAYLSNLVLEPVADEVTLALDARITGDEDKDIPLNIRPTSSDPSETFTVTISGIPAGAELYYNGALLTLTDGGVKIAEFDSSKELKLRPLPNSNEDFQLTVDAYTVDGTSAPGPQESLTIDVSIRGVADEATITSTGSMHAEADVDAAAGLIPLKNLVTTSLADNDGSEVLTLRVSGLPEGFSLSQGTLVVGGTGSERVWLLTPDQIATVNVRVPQNFSGTQAFTVTPVTTENDGDARTGNPQTVEFTVTPSTEATVTTSATIGEDTLTNLNLGIVHQNGDTDETLTTVWIPVDADAGKNFTLYLGETKLSESGLAPVDVEGTNYYVLTGTQIG